MTPAGLRLEQAPPLRVVLRFLLSAPVFGVLAGVLLVWRGPEAFASRHTMESLALAHLFALGFMGATMLGSAQTPQRSDSARNSIAPHASASKYGGTGCAMRKRNAPPASRPSCSAAITAVSPGGAAMRASKVMRTPGESCSGTHERVRIAWPCV